MPFGRLRSPALYGLVTRGSRLSLGWCYKRTNRLAQAIDSLEQALREHPDDALLHYNLACYWTLAENGTKALDALSMALNLTRTFVRGSPTNRISMPFAGTPVSSD